MQSLFAEVEKEIPLILEYSDDGRYAWPERWALLEAKVEKLTSTNTSSPKLPDIEELYKAIPFPKDEKECAMFCAGLAEAHKFITGEIGR